MDKELLTIVVASVSCTAFCLVMVTLLVVVRKEPLCCGCRQPEAYQEEDHYCSSQPFIRPPGNQPPGGLFVVGKPTHYHLNGPMPRLPSYESVRRKDRERHFHTVIAQRFRPGRHSEPPPSYEESLQQSMDVSAVHLQPPHFTQSEL